MSLKNQSLAGHFYYQFLTFYSSFKKVGAEKILQHRLEIFNINILFFSSQLKKTAPSDVLIILLKNSVIAVLQTLN